LLGAGDNDRADAQMGSHGALAEGKHLVSQRLRDAAGHVEGIYILQTPSGF
jgi:hypothetical protein